MARLLKEEPDTSTKVHGLTQRNVATRNLPAIAGVMSLSLLLGKNFALRRQLVLEIVAEEIKQLCKQQR